ncbi:Uncharacterised protein [Bifidobacterium longum subsp. infantis]|uniref:Uncharacterized protein n=1 Tax=Bifidobacterium longum subsp. infantis TaxID=1682 RepID=A0A564S155_BIFLI|nr:Uncharacterised protein [Bifidobacterium longum subsp. infantis]
MLLTISMKNFRKKITRIIIMYLFALTASNTCL